MTPKPVDVPARFQSAVGADEVADSFAWARVPRSHSPGLTFLGVRVFVDAVDLVRSRVALGKIRARSVALGFPLDRKMAMLVTTQRLVIWRASRRGWTKPKLLGEVPRDRVVSARFPYVGGGWRIVDVRLVDGRGVRFLVDGRTAEEFVAVLGRPD